MPHSKKIEVGNIVKIYPRFDVYGMAGAFVNKIGEVKKIKNLLGGYTVAEVYIKSMDRTAVVQTKHLEITKGRG